MKATCIIEGCAREGFARGWCRMHYARWFRLGTTDLPSPAPVSLCAVEDCDRAAVTRGWCGKHYQRWLQTGDVSERIRPLAERFWEKVDKSGDCWLWTGAKKRYGYGNIWDGAKLAIAHRVAYELEVGPIPEGLTIDHLCRNTSCVRPTHLEPVTMAENTRRMLAARREMSA